MVLGEVLDGLEDNGRDNYLGDIPGQTVRMEL